MSRSEMAASHPVNFAQLFADACDASLDSGQLDAVSDADLSAALVSAIKLFAAKAQSGEVPELFRGNHTVSATDGSIAATAILEAVGVEVFELAAWQACSRVGSRRKSI